LGTAKPAMPGSGSTNETVSASSSSSAAIGSYVSTTFAANPLASLEAGPDWIYFANSVSNWAFSCTDLKKTYPSLSTCVSLVSSGPYRIVSRACLLQERRTNKDATTNKLVVILVSIDCFDATNLAKIAICINEFWGAALMPGPDRHSPPHRWCVS